MKEGTVFIGGSKMYSSKIKYLRFSKDMFEVSEHQDLEDIEIRYDCVNWISITSLEHQEIIEVLDKKFNISPMVIEDIKNINLLPKVEEYKDYLFTILEDVKFDKEERCETKQLSLILFKNLIISIEEGETNLFEEISRKIKDRVNILENTADSILYEVVEVVVEDYFDVLEIIGEKIDKVEDNLLFNPTNETLSEIYTLKRDLISTRKTLWLMRNAMNKIVKNDFNLIGNKALNNFREIYDNIVQLVDLTETYRDICSGMLDIYLSSIGNKTNDIMKVLTILSTIFIPLTFLAGIYGMNFKHIPEINWEYGYIGFWIVSVIITGFMIRFFKRKKWM